MSWNTVSSVFSAISPSHLGSGPQLCSCWTLTLNNPASVHITARGLSSKPVPHRGNQPYCSCHGKQAPNPLDPRSYCCRALGAKKKKKRKDRWRSNDSHFSRSHQATTARAGVDSEAAADLWLFVTHSRITPSALPPSLIATCLFFSSELSPTPLWPLGWRGWYPEHHTAVCAAEEGDCQGKKSWLRALVMCSVVVAVSSRRDPSCLLRSRITHSLSVLLRAQQHHLPECRNTVCHDKKKLLRCRIMTTDPSSIEIVCELQITD